MSEIDSETYTLAIYLCLVLLYSLDSISSFYFGLLKFYFGNLYRSMFVYIFSHVYRLF